MAQWQVHRRKAERAAELLAVRDMSGQRVVAPEQCRGKRKIAGGQRVSHGGARRPLSIDGDRAHGLDAELARCAAQEGEIAHASTSEAEVFTDQQPAHMQLPLEDLGDELICRA
jgi:hypothetical protein